LDCAPGFLKALLHAMIHQKRRVSRRTIEWFSSSFMPTPSSWLQAAERAQTTFGHVHAFACVVCVEHG